MKVRATREFALAAGWILLLALGLASAAQAAGEPGSFPWAQGSYADAQRSAKEGGRKLLVVVSTKWCEPCRRLKTQVFESADMKAVAGRIVAIEIDAETAEGKPLAEGRSVERYPTSLFLNADGVEEARIVGFRELPGYMMTVNRWLDGTLPPPQARQPTDGVKERWVRAARAAWAGEPGAEAQLEELARLDASGEHGVGGLARLVLADRVLRAQPKGAAKAAKALQSLKTELGGSRAAALAAWPLARALAEDGKAQAALKLLTSEVRAKPGDRNRYWHIARLAWAYPKIDQKRALELAREGLKLHPDFDELWDLVGQVEARRGNATEARRAFETAQGLRPNLGLYQRRLSAL